MIDWIAFLDSFLYWVQWATTLTFLVLILIAFIGYFVSKRTMFSCMLIAIVLFVVAFIVENQLGIPLLPPEFWNFFQGIFN